MPTLTLTPGRCLASDSFEEGCYAYAFTDRPVRKDGKLVIDGSLYVKATEEGTMSFDLDASTVADNTVEFSYTVAIFDNQGNKMFTHNIVMPDQDVTLFDLVQEVFDMDDHEFIPTVCDMPETGDDL